MENVTAEASAPPMHEVPLFADYPAGLLQFASAFCVLYIVVGIPGNVITIAALSRYKKGHNATAIFIINLSVTDLLLCCFNLPLAASLFIHQAWVHGQALCVLFPVLRYGLIAVSLFTILAITINRYVIIGHPDVYNRMYQPKILALMITAIWLSAFMFLVPTMSGRWGHFGLDLKIGSCTILPNADGSSPKDFLFVIAFLLPAVAFCVCYARIFLIVRRTERLARQGPRGGTRPPPASPAAAETSLTVSEVKASHLEVPEPAGERKPSHGSQLIVTLASTLRDRGSPRAAGSMSAKDKRLLKMILVIFLSFVLCYLPITIVKVLGKELDAPVINVLGYVLIYLTTCTNPIIYVAMSSEYRKAYRQLLSCGRRQTALPSAANRSGSRV
ncbi:G-protein coupled receptor moody-like [Pollicipes pollicipes]|uniref:G-protein coupled receptor moody-like n=1 Tax=Pollicipes pollicipes TaxID=41117 RepID=UPI001885013A|nr:G-protein coupled receptor moody-like [Pollicipes pollicipes]